MSSTRTSQSAARTLRVMLALKGHSLHGLSNGDLAKALNESPATINRCINTLIQEGVAIQLENGRFAMSIKLLQVIQAHANEIAKAQARINEINQRVQAGAHQ